MYKDKDRQREANRQAKQRQREAEKEVREMLGIPKRGQGMTLEQGIVKTYVIPKRTAQGNVRVSKPGDPDYEPQCETTRAFIEDRPKRAETSKRGKDIKCFEDLPPDIQRTINQMSIVEGKIDQTIKANRTAIAVNYQHLFPDRYYSTGVM